VHIKVIEDVNYFEFEYKVNETLKEDNYKVLSVDISSDTYKMILIYCDFTESYK
jgi:hypothetical protein